MATCSLGRWGGARGRGATSNSAVADVSTRSRGRGRSGGRGRGRAALVVSFGFKPKPSTDFVAKDPKEENPTAGALLRMPQDRILVLEFDARVCEREKYRA